MQKKTPRGKLPLLLISINSFTMSMDLAFYPKQVSTLLTALVVEESRFAKKLFLVALMLANDSTSPPMNFLNQDVTQFPAHH